jgi:hypothetical protein
MNGTLGKSVIGGSDPSREDASGQAAWFSFLNERKELPGGSSLLSHIPKSRKCAAPSEQQLESELHNAWIARAGDLAE